VTCEGCKQATDISFSMAFQPIVNVRNGDVFAYEALVRSVEGAGAGTVLSQSTRKTAMRLISSAVSRLSNWRPNFSLLRVMQAFPSTSCRTPSTSPGPASA
jgi:EAL domain-containing protein (putative c-di-GMP-specific phosphodiesterase class I)